ncbi:salivary endonuclease-like, partial [Rhynchophorus ferrugineus]|uniref:salivary endonuclease-like n=1 Tax=Rhynchophorus ferrugineus TaxID=354439 RepID=UPI003FCE2CD1
YQTFFLVNAAPQWQIINANNWYKVETSIRDYAEANQVDLLQWTGVYGVLSVNNTNNIKTELYLYSKNDELYIPVPEVFWKVVYDPIYQKGAAIIGLNNPYAENYTVFCDDVSDLTKWVNFKKSNTAKGLIFVCNVTDFRKTVKYLPEFSVTGLLV